MSCCCLQEITANLKWCDLAASSEESALDGLDDLH